MNDVPPHPVGPALPPRPSAGTPASSHTPSAVARHWLQRIRRAGMTPTDPEPAEPLPAAPPTVNLLNRSPFQIGFLVTVGGMTALGIVLAVVSLKTIVVLVLLSLFLSLGLNPVVEWLQKRGVPRPAAVGIVALVLVLVLSLGLWAVVPVVSEQINTLVVNFPSYLTALRTNQQIAAWDAEYQIIEKATQFLEQGSWMTSTFGGIMGAGMLLANVVFSVIITLVLTLYFLGSLPAIKNVIYQLAPASRRARVRYLANEMFGRIGGYMSGMFVVVTLWAVGSFIVFNAVGLGRFSLALTVVVAMFAFIPVVGSFVALAICTLIAFSQSATTGVIVLAYFLIYQQLDAYVVQPRVFSRSLNVPAVLVILGAISGGLLFGVVGALLAIPTVASLLLLYREVVVPHLDRL